MLYCLLRVIALLNLLIDGFANLFDVIAEFLHDAMEIIIAILVADEIDDSTWNVKEII